MSVQKTAVACTLALLAAGCAATGGQGTDDYGLSDPVFERPTYTPGVSEDDFCPEGEEIEALEATPESSQVRLWHNNVISIDGTVDPAPEKLACSYFYTKGDEPVDRLTDDIATPVVEFNILEEASDVEVNSAQGPADFPEFPEYFQITGWDHTATEEETETCLRDPDHTLYGDCPDGEVLVMEVFTLTGYDSNLQVDLQIEYRYTGAPAASDSDRAAEIESASRQMAGELLPLLLERVPTEGV